MEYLKTTSAWAPAGAGAPAGSVVSGSAQRDETEDPGTGTIIAPEETKPALKRPPMFKVVLLNEAPFGPHP